MFAKLRIIFVAITALVISITTSYTYALSCSASADSWGNGYVINVTVKNDGTSAVNGWQVSLNFNQNPAITGSWNADVSSSGTTVTASNLSWNSAIGAGQNTSFGFQGTHNGNFQLPTCSGGANTPQPSPTNIPTPTPTSATPTPGPTATPTSPPPPTDAELVLQENAAGFCNVEGTVDNNNTGFTGDGFANTENASGRSISWRVNVGFSSTYGMEFRYANGSVNNRTGALKVNSSNQGNVNFPTTGSWTSWTVDTVTVNLNSGINDIVLQASTAEGLPNIDSLTINGSGIAGVNCKVVATPTPTPSGPVRVYIAGDSTVSTYKDTSSPNDQAGWGQMIPEQYNANVSFYNHAIGGRTARRFIDEGRLDAIWNVIKSGDYLLVQFGTNDGHKTATYTINGVTIPYYLDPATDFKYYLQKYIDGAKARGVTLIFVTPPPRNSAYCTGGNGTGAHAQAMRELAADKGIALSDLNKKTVNYLTAICPSPTPEDFFLLRADGTVDGTHFQENGARILSRFVADGISESALLNNYRK